MVVVPKKEDVRICVDLTKLNESVRRERHEMPSVEYTLGQLSDARIFSKLDANSGFWQVPLADESALLTTFITPFGRFCFKRLPFSISSAPQHFQRRMSAILEGIDGVLCQMDDKLIFGATQSQHDGRIREVLRLQKENATLNSNKCQFSVQGAKTIKKNTNPTQNKSQTHRAKQYEVTSFLSTDCELSTETCSKNVYSIGPLKSSSWARP